MMMQGECRTIDLGALGDNCLLGVSRVLGPVLGTSS